MHDNLILNSGVASVISEGGIFIYSRSAQLISFEIESTPKKIDCAEHEYMNMSPSLIALVTPLILNDFKGLFISEGGRDFSRDCIEFLFI